MKRFREQSEYWYGLTYYDWKFRVTGDDKYLKEKLEYIEKHKNDHII